MSNPYQILGVSQNASMDEVKQAYRRLAKKYHPDVSKEPDAEEKFKEIQNAYDQIKNPQPQPQWSDNPFEDFGFFSDLFNQTRRRHHIISVSVTLEECYTGCIKQVQGKSVQLQPGIRTGTKLLIDNDTIVQIVVLPHRKFQRNNDDLLIMVELSVAEAMFGTNIEISHINGKKYAVKVPPSIQPQQTIKLNGLGLPNPKYNHSGDLFVQFSITIPTIAALTTEQKQAIMSTGFREKLTI